MLNLHNTTHTRTMRARTRENITRQMYRIQSYFSQVKTTSSKMCCVWTRPEEKYTHYNIAKKIKPQQKQPIQISLFFHNKQNQAN